MKKRVFSLVAAALICFVLSAGKISVSAARYRESEPNDYADKATAVNMGDAVSGNLSNESDVDWFRFVSTGDSVVVEFDHPCSGTATYCWHITLYDSNGNKSLHSFNVPGDRGANLIHNGLTEGETYYIVISKATGSNVTANGFSGEDYTVTITESWPTAEPDSGSDKKADSGDTDSKKERVEPPAWLYIVLGTGIAVLVIVGVILASGVGDSRDDEF